jgi:hypothetical protein
MAQINKPNQYFNTVLYTGNASASRAITGVGFQPDWVWVKGRSTAYYHALWDVVRTNKSALYSNTADAEDTGTGGTLGSFNSDGFTLPNESGGFVNNNGTTYVSWNWLGANGTTANTDGSISSTVSANTTSGFSIVSYTGNGTAGATVGHGLGAVPKMFIVKRLNATGGWVVYNEAIGNTKIIELHDTGAAQTSSAAWNNTSPTSSVFTLGDYTSTNQSGGTYVAYCFADVKGFSKMGSYIGNGNADGTFVYTGFKPAFIMAKNSVYTGNWVMKDNKRSGTSALQNFGQMNPNQTENPSANLSNAENKASAFAVDILSNGFKMRGVDNAGSNWDGNTYIYMAFAENPLVGTNNIPATAR